MESEQEPFREKDCLNHARRQFLRFLLISPLLGSAGLISCSTILASRPSTEDFLSTDTQRTVTDPDLIKLFPSETAPLENFFDATNVFQFEDVARTKLTPDIFHFIADGADDLKTVRANREAFDLLQIRARRLVNVSKVDTTVNVLGHAMETPIILAPVGAQQMLHQEGEIASARAAASRKHLFIVAMLSSFSAGEIAAAGQSPIWFQLYPSPDRTTTQQLLRRAEAAGADVVVLTVDGPVRGNRERENWYRSHRQLSKPPRLGNLENLKGRLRIGDPSLTWDIINWLKSNTQMKVVIKGIVTHEDARLCVKHGADGLIVSNHGGRQEGSNRGTLECLPEVVEAIDGQIPVLVDGGFRRGTDIFKALALGAQAICIGRPYLWGLATFGEDGVKKVLDLLRSELVRIMQLAGTPSIPDISSTFVKWKGCK
jgi:isopentenyl diphosphate isomerase/L-lactate dehydrogenase-like FMN-dependent dehydrogenase